MYLKPSTIAFLLLFLFCNTLVKAETDRETLQQKQKFISQLETMSPETLTKVQQQYLRLHECIESPTFQSWKADLISPNSALSVDVYKLESKAKEGISFAVGTAAALKMFSYDLAEKKAGVADGFGLGVPIRMYRGDIHKVKEKCRPRTWRLNLENDPLEGSISAHLISLTPTLYFSKKTNDDDLTLAPAIVLSFFEDIFHFGTGFNLSGENQGNVFLLFGIGTQLPGETE